ncbi:MAG: AAA family ATPase [Oscillatoria sp. SIO1A7]|nr:AAA family ATPase [Oscillatoria sp. SIO1A7]
MSTIAKYQIVTKVYESANSIVYRALAHADERYVILKVLKKDYPNPSELTRYKQEYEITRSLNTQGTVSAYELLPYENTLAIALEDFGGQSLDSWLKSRHFKLLEFLRIAIQIAEALAVIHGANVIHKDINPSNIILNSETGETKIIDFGISSIFTKETPVLKNPDVLEGTLAYMSPEQTGRMNRYLDYRTDFYSLGATFYRILTGQLVFESSDALELVHCHIARTPIPPDEIDSSIPKTISGIVMKLLAKTAEERYQTGLGLKADLEECYKQLEQTGRITEFTLASRDFAEELQISQKLYGRESEIEQLLETFKSIAEESNPPQTTDSQKRAEMMLVGGFSGIGKTALIQELYRPISQQRGYFITGKFDQFQRNIPYSAVVSAFQSLVRQLLTESQAQLNQWRDKLNEALGVNGQVLVDVIPEIEQIIGKQPPVQALEPAQAQNRFNSVFQSLIRVFCQKEHPLVMFLDDLQWADLGTLKLIELMMSDRNTSYLLLLGAYRDNEVDANHPTIITIESLKEQGAKVSQIILTPLKIEDISQLLIDTLHRDRETVNDLAELILQKTSGNPFFINEFLKTIERENIFIFNRDCQFWEWKTSQVAALGITDNVVELMIGKLRKFSDATQLVLRLAACIGNRFDLKTLSIIYEQSESATFQELVPAIQQGLIQPLSELETTSEALLESKLILRDYKFRHDRIQQAAYALIAPEQRNPIHLRVGNLLLAGLEESEREEKLFTLVDHLNKGIDLVIDTDEKIKLVELNLRAGKKAKKAVAHAAAREYLTVASEEFPGDIWQDCYELAIDLYRELAEVEYINGNFEKSQSIIEMALDSVRADLDGMIFYLLQIREINMLGRYEEALVVGRRALKRIEADLPEGDFTAAFEREMLKNKEALGDREIDALYENPDIISLNKKAEFELLHDVLSSAWATNPDLTNVVISKMVNINIEYGHTPFCPVAYVFFAIINTHALKKYRVGYEYSSLGLKLSDKYGNLSSKGIGLCYHANMTMPWLRHIKESEKVNNESFNTCLEVGDIQFAGYGTTYSLYNLVYQGKDLEIILKEASRRLQFSQRNRNKWAIDCLLAANIILKNLTGKTHDRYSFDIEETTEINFFDEEDSVAALCFYKIFKAQVLYLYEQPAPLTILEESAELFGYIPATISIAKHNFYYSLTLIAHYPEASPEEQKKYRQQIETNQKEMKDWADRCPDNFIHKYLLVGAEMARVSGEWQEAMGLYDRAIESAKEHEFVQNEALGNELAAKFWLSLGKEDFAKLYMRKARQGYQIWGAVAKVRDLEEKYPEFFRTVSSRTATDITTTISSTTTGSSTGEALDLATIIEASQAISGEIKLGALLEKLLLLAFKNAGAQKGILILADESETITIEASGEAEGEIQVLQSIPVSESQDLPIGIINYVQRTKEDVVLSEATTEGIFTGEAYIVGRQPKSILCAAIVNQGKLLGILYLENNLATGAFTPDRLELLKVISAQAAISIENALLYRTLEQKVDQRTAELAEANEEIKILNKQLESENLRMSAELDVTKQLQQKMLPDEDELLEIKELDIAGFMEPADEVGGDYYDVLQQDGKIKIGIGDVTGHGLESGMLMIMAQTATRVLLESDLADPVKFLDILNRTLCKNVMRMKTDKNMTLSILDYEQGTVTLSGQHEEMILVRAGGHLEIIDTVDLGVPVGLDLELGEFFNQTQIELNSGDLIVLYTDGITEAENSEKEFYGFDRLCNLARENWQLSAADIRQLIIEDVKQFIGEQKVYDDITLLAIKKR